MHGRTEESDTDEHRKENTDTRRLREDKEEKENQES